MPQFASTLDEVLTLRAENDRLRKALRPFADRVYNDNGDVTFNLATHETQDYWLAYCLLRRYDNPEALKRNKTTP